MLNSTRADSGQGLPESKKNILVSIPGYNGLRRPKSNLPDGMVVASYLSQHSELASALREDMRIQ